MPTTIVYLEHAEGKLRSSSLPAISFGRKLGQLRSSDVVGLIVGEGAPAASAAKEAAAFFGKVLLADKAGLGQVLPETHAAALSQVAKAVGATSVCATATNAGKDLLPRASALLGAAMASDVIEVLGASKFRRPMFAGNALADIEVTTPIVVASVRQSEFPAAEPLPNPGAVEAAPGLGDVDAGGAAIVSIEAVKRTRPDLAEARVVVSGGRGMREGKNFAVLETLADLLGGAVGASRAACDSGMVPNDLQVGQTGKVVAPELYIAVALSGAIQHLAGMKGSKVIVAINKDPEAPIFQVADYGLVGNWEQLVPALTEKIRSRIGK